MKYIYMYSYNTHSMKYIYSYNTHSMKYIYSYNTHACSVFSEQTLH